MACFNPKVAYRSEQLTKNGKRKIRFLSDQEADANFQDLKDDVYFLIPCGKCEGCRLDHARHWADRLVLEMDHMKKAVFLTLTYSPGYLPPSAVSPFGEPIYIPNEKGRPVSPLVPDHMPEFMKRLRERLNREDMLVQLFQERRSMCNSRRDDGWPQVKIRFFGCGEYGEERGRPHLHIILFGLSLDDLAYLQGSSLKMVKKNELGQVTYGSEFLANLWDKGYADVSEVSQYVMNYVARYTQKKANGNDYAIRYGLPDEFIRMSRRPGIGAYFLEDHPGVIDQVSYWRMADREIYWPSYLVRKNHEKIVDIESFDIYNGTAIHTDYKTLDVRGLQTLKEKHDSAVNKFLNTFESDSRPYKEHQLFLQRQLHERVKKAKRGDVNDC